jgi:aldehyde:ferredoxin oxidoreductase
MKHAEGPLLTIDVGERETRTESIDDVLESFVGGRGIAIKLAHKRVPFDADFEDLLAVGSHVVELERHFNNQRGIEREADRLPYDLPGFEAALDEYYAVRGWNEDGTVPESQISGRADAANEDN